MDCTLLFSAKTRNVGQLEGDNLLSYSVVILILSALFFPWQYVSVHGTGTVFLNNESIQKNLFKVTCFFASTATFCQVESTIFQKLCCTNS